MDREQALDRLPQVYAAGLRLKDQGQADATIAQELHIAIEAVGPLLRLAERKLASVLRQK